jgi:hypothetical protein
MEFKPDGGGGHRPKPEFPKTEGRKKSETRNPNQLPTQRASPSPFRISGFGLLSGFGFRPSDFCAATRRANCSSQYAGLALA